MKKLFLGLFVVLMAPFVFAKQMNLRVLSLEEVSRLNHEKRAEYIGELRKAVLDIDKAQRQFKGRHAFAVNGEVKDKNEFYADMIELLIGKDAIAQAAGAKRNKCIYALNESRYEDAGLSDGRNPFKCLLVECNYGKKIKGVRCGFVASGLINEPEIGCLPLEKSTNAIDKTHASLECWKKREALEKRDRAAVTNMIADSNKFFGFDSGEHAPDVCKTTQARDFMNGLIRRSYSNYAYAQFIKIGYFCHSSGQGLPPGLINYEGVSEALTFNQIEKDFNGLQKHAVDIFASIGSHCSTELSPRVVNDIRSGANLKRVPKGSSPYEMERLRQKYLSCIETQEPLNNLTADMSEVERAHCTDLRAKKPKPSHESVLEVEECKYAYLGYESLKRAITDIAGTYPRIKEQPIPEVPKGPIDGSLAEVTPTGCSESVARADSLLPQVASRCMPCLIQSHEAKKTGAGNYRPSRKFLALMSTMALACGDGLVNGTVVKPQLMVDYWQAFGHCSSETYEWTGRENKGLVEAWGEKKGKEGFWRGKKGDKNASTYPDRDGEFARAYGLTLETAKKLFCDPNGREYNYAAGAGERKRFLETRRRQFNQEKMVLERGVENSVADNLMSCFNEASANATRFHQGSNICYAFTDGNDPSSPAFKKAMSDWDEGYPTIIDVGDSCYIAKQKEVYRATCDTSSDPEVCIDRNKDGKDDNKGCACGGTITYYSYVEPGVADKSFRVQLQDSKYGITPDGNVRPNQAFGAKQSARAQDYTRIAYRDDNACPITASESSNLSRPSRSAQ